VVEQASGSAVHGEPVATGGGAAMNPWAITSLVLGILAVLTGCLLIGGVLGLAAIGVGIIALASPATGETPRRGRGLAIAGVVLGLVGTLVAAAVIVTLPGQLREARSGAWRAMEASNLRMISVGMMGYSLEYDGLAPLHPSLLASENYIPSDAMTSPLGPDATPAVEPPPSGQPIAYRGFVYMPVDRISTVRPDRVIAFSRFPGGDGRRNVLMADGRVDQMDDVALQAAIGPAIDLDQYTARP
jgi:prepilin-type processing-associated H-X9-DG protein